MKFTGRHEIQDECKNCVATNGKLLPSQFYISAPGKLQVKGIIHAVGPIFQSGKRNEESTLYTTVYNALEAAENEHWASIAMPAISTGVDGFPLNKVCIFSCLNFLKPNLLENIFISLVCHLKTFRLEALFGPSLQGLIYIVCVFVFNATTCLLFGNN